MANAARKPLDDAAGIDVPERTFIVKVLVCYLCLLVPGNWLVFRLLRRVEWAWIAAPLIAIGCTVMVIYLAQLNIGFARSRNEIAVVEMQAEYPRVHVARYTVLYTSLGTRYEFTSTIPPHRSCPSRTWPPRWKRSSPMSLSGRATASWSAGGATIRN